MTIRERVAPAGRELDIDVVAGGKCGVGISSADPDAPAHPPARWRWRRDWCLRHWFNRRLTVHHDDFRAVLARQTRGVGQRLGRHVGQFHPTII